jgi:hypothetical protein
MVVFFCICKCFWRVNFKLNPPLHLLGAENEIQIDRSTTMRTMVDTFGTICEK